MFAALSKRVQFTRALKSRPYTMIWIGQTISNLGDGIFNIALDWSVLPGRPFALVPCIWLSERVS